MRALIFIACLALAGCEARGWEITSIQEACASHGGIHSLVHFGGFVRGICTDGTSVPTKRGKPS